MARVYYNAAAAGRNTSTTVSYSDQVSLTFTGTANKKYLMLWGCLLDNASTTSDSLARLYHDTGAAAFQTFNFEAQDTTDNYQVAGAWIYTASASPTSQTFSVEYANETSGNTTGCQDGYLIALELHANDLTSVTAAEQTTTSGTYVDIGPSVTTGAGTWLLIGSSEIKNAGAGPAGAHVDQNWAIHDGTSGVVVSGPAYLQDTTNYTPWLVMARVQPGSSTTYKARYKNSNAAGETINARNTTLVALDLSQFADVIYGDSLGESTTTSSSAQTKLTVTDIPLAMDYLQLFACSRKTNSTSSSGYTDYTRGGAAISVEDERENNDVDEYNDRGYGAVSTLTASSTTWLVRYRNEDNATTTYIKNAAFAGLGLGDATTTYTKTASLNAAISKTSTATATLNAAVQKAATATASLNAAVQKSASQTASLNAAVQKTGTATASLDAAVQAARTASASLDAALQKTMMETADLDAVIQKAGTADAAMDAAIQISATVSAQLSAAIQAARSATASLDAVIEAAAAGTTISASLDAAIQATGTASASMDAAIQAAGTATASLDAYITTAEVVAEVISGGGGGWKKRKADFTDWWVEWSKSKKLRRDRKLAKEVEQYREQAGPRVLAALDSAEVERVARLEAQLRAIEYGRRELVTRQAINALLAQIAAVRAMLWQAELDADDEDVLLLLT